MDRVLILLALVAAVGIGALLLRRRRHHAPGAVDPADLGLEGARGVGVVGFSSRYCIPCQEWEQLLSHSGIDWRKVDVGERPELARKYGIRETPLVLAVALPEGRVVEAFHGHPHPGDVERLDALAEH